MAEQLTESQLAELLEQQRAAAPFTGEDTAPGIELGPNPGEAGVDGADSGHVLFVWSAAGYALLAAAGEPPPVGSDVATSGGRRVVTKVGPSPLPGDPRPCAYLDG